MTQISARTHDEESISHEGRQQQGFLVLVKRYLRHVDSGASADDDAFELLNVIRPFCGSILCLDHECQEFDDALKAARQFLVTRGRDPEDKSGETARTGLWSDLECRVFQLLRAGQRLRTARQTRAAYRESLRWAVFGWDLYKDVIGCASLDEDLTREVQVGQELGVEA
jgi:hypothetical protein